MYQVYIFCILFKWLLILDPVMIMYLPKRKVFSISPEHEQPAPAPTASRIGHCPSIIEISRAS